MSHCSWICISLWRCLTLSAPALCTNRQPFRFLKKRSWQLSIINMQTLVEVKIIINYLSPPYRPHIFYRNKHVRGSESVYVEWSFSWTSWAVNFVWHYRNSFTPPQTNVNSAIIYVISNLHGKEITSIQRAPQKVVHTNSCAKLPAIFVKVIL